jgi:hypothetical protein
MAQVIEKEAAELELARIVEFFEVEPEGDDWEANKARLIQVIGKGRIIMDEDKSAVILQLVAPLELENGETVRELAFREPTAGGLKKLDRFKDNEKMAKTIALASDITGQPVGVIDRMGSRDLSTMGAIVSLFF